MQKDFCCVPGCKTRNNQGISFHRFPKEPPKRDRWIEILQIDKRVLDSTRVCSLHFDDSCFFFPNIKRKRRMLKKDSYPSKMPQHEMEGLYVRTALQLAKGMAKDCALPADPPIENSSSHVRTFTGDVGCKKILLKKYSYSNEKQHLKVPFVVRKTARLDHKSSHADVELQKRNQHSKVVEGLGLVRQTNELDPESLDASADPQNENQVSNISTFVDESGCEQSLLEKCSRTEEKFLPADPLNRSALIKKLVPPPIGFYYAVDKDTKVHKFYCCVTGCRSTSHQGISFHTFPKEPAKRHKWMSLLRITKPVKDSSRVCSLHFDVSCFFLPGPGIKTKRRMLKKGSYPNELPLHMMRGRGIRKKRQYPPAVRKDSEAHSDPPYENPAYHVSAFAEAVLCEPTLLEKSPPTVYERQSIGSGHSSSKNGQHEPEISAPPNQSPSTEKRIDSTVHFCHLNLSALSNMQKNYCSVPGCKSKNAPGISFHIFPKELLKRDKWIQFLQINKPVTDNSRVCSIHFEDSCFFLPAIGSNRKILKKGSIPTKRLQAQTPERNERRTFQVGPTISEDSAAPVELPNGNSASLEDCTVRNTGSGGLGGTSSRCMDVRVGTPKVSTGENSDSRGMHSDDADSTPTLEMLHQQSSDIVNLRNKLRNLEFLLTSYRRSLFGVENMNNAMTCGQPCLCNPQENNLGECEEGSNSVACRLPKMTPNTADTKSTTLENARLTSERQGELRCRLDRLEQDAEAGCLRAAFLLEQIKNHDRKRGTWSNKVMRLCAKWMRRDFGSYNHVRRMKMLFLPGPENARMK